MGLLGAYAQAIRNSGATLEAAETKLKLAELVSALADSKIALVSVQELLAEKESEITSLKASLELRKKLIRYGDSYYETTEEGEPVGDPYCSHCFETKGLAVHISQTVDRRQSACPACKSTYLWQRRKKVGDSGA